MIGSNSGSLVRFTLENPLSVDRLKEPVSSGFPIPYDKKIQSTDCFVLYDCKGSRVNAQFLPLAWWDDGKSFKWVLMSFQADVPAGGSTHYYLDFDGLRCRAESDHYGIAVCSGRISVDTGKLKFNISRDDGRIIQDIQVNINGNWMEIGNKDNSFFNMRVIDNSGNVLIPGAPEEIKIEDNGTERAVVKVAGKYRGTTESAQGLNLLYVVRITAYRGYADIKFEHNLINAGSTASIQELALVLDTGEALCSINQGYDNIRTIDLSPYRKDGCAGILHDNENYHFVGRLDDENKAQLVKGRFEGWFCAKTLEGWAVSVAAAEFWQKYPKSLETHWENIKIGLLPLLSKNKDSFKPAGQFFDCYELAEGEARTHEAFISFHAPDENVRDIARKVAAFNSPMLPLAPWVWYTSSGALGDLSPRDSDRYTEFEGTVDKTFKAILERREKLGLYGDRNYGDDEMGKPGIWNNCEYDYPHVGMLQFLRGSGNEWYFLYAAPAARHMLSIDAVNAGKDAGRIHPHSIRHNSGQPKLGSHSWLQGLTEYYAFSGDFRARDVIIRSAERWSDDILHKAPGEATERATTWPVISLLSVYGIFPKQKYKEAAKRQIDKVVSLHDFNDGHFGGSFERLNTPPSNWSTFLIGSPLLEALVMYYQATGEEIVKDVIVSTAKRLARINWLEDSQTWEYTISTVPPGERWTNPKTDRMVSPGVGYAYLYSGDRDLWYKACTAFKNTWGIPVEDGKTMAQSFRFGVRMIYLMDRIDLIDGDK